MIKVSVLYPNQDDARFDIDYYCANHMRMVQEKLGSALKGMEIDHGVGGAEPGAKPPFLAMGHLYFDSAAAFEEAFTPHVEAIMGDIKNYTNVTAIVQISDVRML